MARTEALSRKSLNDAKTHIKKLKYGILEENQINKQLDAIIPGEPTPGRVLLKVRDEEVKEETKQMLATNTDIHEVIAVSQVNNEKIKPGTWIQLTKGCMLEELEWGSRRYVMVREMNIAWVFDRNPREEFEKVGRELFGEKQDNDNAKIAPVSYTTGNA